MRKVLALAMVALLAPSAQAVGQTGALDVVKKMKAAFESPKPSVRKLNVLESFQGETVQYSVLEARRTAGEQRWVSRVLAAPPDVAGNAFLITQSRDRDIQIWTWIPFVRRVREIIGMDVYQHVFHTEFTYADLGWVRLRSKYKVLGPETKNGTKAIKLQETMVNGQGYYYSKILIWVDANTYLPIERNYFDVAGALWKVETFEFTTVDGVPTPVKVTMKDVQGGGSSEIQLVSVSYDASIPDETFTVEGLPKLGESAIWQAVNK